MVGAADESDERRLIGGFWTLVVSILLMPVVFPTVAFLYMRLVPAYSADVYIPPIDATVALKFYWVWDEMKDNGRYLTLRAPGGAVTLNICGWDWAHWARTSVYLTQDRAVAVLGPQECDYLVRPPYRTVNHVFRVPSDNWTYLGAFDFSSSSFRFIPATEQRECIPMLGEDRGGEWLARNSARRERCSPQHVRLTSAAGT
jgi:hypothetical protein